ncbi:glutamate ABC transporter substrate-binding protein [Pseudonocardiaceae bacterium YIM PH 21723]|nr:glutamate ABC transporter substrate-binding protein [Pseudonocardiaceae bacterium YIM PH 21723]
MARTLLAIAVIAALSLTACGGPSTSPSADALVAAAPVAASIVPGTTMEKIRKRGYLIVGGSLDAPLLSQQNPVTEQIEGLDADFGRLLATYILGKPAVEVRSAASETREALLANGTVDVILQTYSITPKRATQVAFAGPYYNSGLVIATRKDQTGIGEPEDLNGKTVIAGANTPAIPAIEKAAPGAKILTFGSAPECLQALRQGRGEAYVQDEAVLLDSVRRTPTIVIQGKPFTSDPYGIGIKHGDAQFKQFVNEWLRTIQASGLWAKTWKNSIGTVVAGDAPPPPAIGSAPGSE